MVPLCRSPWYDHCGWLGAKKTIIVYLKYIVSVIKLSTLGRLKEDETKCALPDEEEEEEEEEVQTTCKVKYEHFVFRQDKTMFKLSATSPLTGGKPTDSPLFYMKNTKEKCDSSYRCASSESRPA